MDGEHARSEPPALPDSKQKTEGKLNYLWKDMRTTLRNVGNKAFGMLLTAKAIENRIRFVDETNTTSSVILRLRTKTINVMVDS